MTTGGLLNPIGAAKYKAPTARPAYAPPSSGAAPDEIANLQVVAPRGGAAAPLPTSRKTIQNPAQLSAGMLNDYYNNIYAIPEQLEVQNPLIGAEQPWAIWNAFLVGNEITARVETGDTGLINDAIVGETFRATQMKPYSIIVTNTAPIQIDATYDYTATFGTTSFRFIASLAAVVDFAPEEPFEQTLVYSTDIFRARFGEEYRMSLRQDKPRQRFSYDLLFETEAERREVRHDLYVNARLPLVLPQWHEYVRINTEAPVGTTIILGDFSLSDIEVGDSVFLENPPATNSELQVVDAITDSQITLRNVLKSTYPVGSHIYPAVSILPDDRPSNRYYPVNAFIESVSGLKLENVALGGKGATVEVFDTFPVLEATPSANQLAQETFNMRSDETDFGGSLDVYLPEATASLIRPHSFYIPDRATLQYWKKFLDTIRGQQKAFLHATYQDDVMPISFVAGSTEVVVENTPQLSDWVLNDTFCRWRIVTGPSQTPAYRKVDTFTDNLDGTATIILDAAIPDEGPSTSIEQISFLQKCRLSGNQVKFKHFDNYSRVSFSTETIIQ